MSDLSESSIPYVAPQILVVIVFMRLTVWNWLTSYQYNKDQLIGPFSSWPMTFLLKQCNSVFPIYISPWSHVPTKDDLSTRPCRRGYGIASAAPRLQLRFCATHVESCPRAGQVFRSWVCFYSLSVVPKALRTNIGILYSSLTCMILQRSCWHHGWRVRYHPHEEVHDQPAALQVRLSGKAVAAV